MLFRAATSLLERAEIDPRMAAMVAALAAINKAKADAKVSMGREVSRLRLAATATTLSILEGVAADVLSAARVVEYAFEAIGRIRRSRLGISAPS